MATTTSFKVTLDGTGAAVVEHGNPCSLLAAIATPALGGDGSAAPCQAFWNRGKYVTVKGGANQSVLVTCIPSQLGPSVDTSPAPVVA